MNKVQKYLMLSDSGYKDLKHAVLACTLSSFSLMIPFSITIGVIMELIKPLSNQELNWNNILLLFIAGCITLFIVFLFNKNEYKKTFVTSYMESKKVRVSIAEHIRRLPMSIFKSKDISELSTNIMGDIATNEHVLSHILPQVIANFISITVVCILLSIFDWRMSLAIFITVPLAFGIIYVGRRIYDKLHRKHAKVKLDASAEVQEYIEGIKVIVACNMSGDNFKKLEDALLEMKSLAVKMEIGTGIFVTGAQVVLQSGIGLCVLMGTILISNGQLSLMTFIIFSLIVVRVYGPLLTELTLLPEFLYHQISLQRIRDIMSIQPMMGKEEITLDNMEIKFEDVDFSYERSKDTVLKNINITIPEKSVTALVGPSGSGKSTMSYLIARFWDVNKGKITIDDVNIKEIDPESLMSYMSFVFQDVILFNDTVYNNIRIGNVEATEEEVLQAAKMACCDDFINKLPDGYNTVLGENGSTLSGGERQRLSIARAFLKDAPIILLDEATASLDPENEEFVQEAITRLIENKTVIVIAHKLKTIKNVDKIIVLENGEIIEEGNHDTLLKNDKLYKKLFDAQKESEQWAVSN